jgi:hypothetical protein
MRETDPLAQYQMPALGRGREQNRGYTMPTTPGGRQMTFAKMQADGMARPAPMDYLQPQLQVEPIKPVLPTAPSAPPVAPQIPTTATTTPTFTPTTLPSTQTYGQPFDRLRQIAMENLSSQFGGQRQALEEDLARRGLAASSIGAGRMGDLAGQYARAQAQLEADLLQQRQAQENADRDLLVRLAALMSGGL